MVSQFYSYATHNKLCNQLAAVKMTLPSYVHLIVRVTQFADDVTIYGMIFGEVCNVPGMLVHFDTCTDSVWQALSSPKRAWGRADPCSGAFGYKSVNPHQPHAV